MTLITGFVPTKKYREAWIRAYLEEKPNRATGSEVTDDEFQTFYQRAVHGIMVC